ncbi:MAG: hypothetical protein CM15mP49_14990 [Actinomycetota bacterium]|nr:MAG: hypothetical protein CM15mP49_14990 [Actinomycetota bacterium]
MIVSSDAQALRTPVDNISIQGRNAAGVLGMKIRDGVKIVGAGAAIGDGAVVTVTDTGSAKVTPSKNFPKGRGGTEFVLLDSRKKRVWCLLVLSDQMCFLPLWLPMMTLRRQIQFL